MILFLKLIENLEISTNLKMVTVRKKLQTATTHRANTKAQKAYPAF